MDRDFRKCLGGRPYEGRRESFEISATLASCDLTRADKSGLTLTPHGCHFEMLQRDVLDFQFADQSIAAVFLLDCSVQSNTGKLKSAAVHLSIQECEDYRFLAVARPPFAAEYAAPQEINGSIQFEESTPGKGIYVGHHTSGTMFCDGVGSTRASMKLFPEPEQGIQELSCLSALLLVCLSASSRLRFDISVSVQASLSKGGILKKWRKGLYDTFVLCSKKVQLSLMP